VVFRGRGVDLDREGGDHGHGDGMGLGEGDGGVRSSIVRGDIGKDGIGLASQGGEQGLEAIVEARPGRMTMKEGLFMAREVISLMEGLKLCMNLGKVLLGVF